MQTLTIQARFFPSKKQQTILRRLGEEYIRVVNTLAEGNGRFPKITTKDVDAYRLKELKQHFII